ncbi:hypothetical protein M6B38_384670 [Iris pallida]|uniref:Uncharacterized protein n=1 Tax=Iris pallida TaxID=29817 RepID=A0AAX6G3Y2_IRIPA|nr:hypothetical protein M6B38_384670 [Iris pallida]
MELLIKFVNILSKMLSISNILLSLCYYIIIIKKENKSFINLYFTCYITQKISIFNWERWLSGLKRQIANPLYELFVPRVRIPLSPLPLITSDFLI